MNFELSEEQAELRQAVREFVQAELSIAQTRALWEQPTPFSAESWAKLARLGWLGLTVPEAEGGSGLGVLELSLVCEAMGTTVACSPYWSTVALGIPLIQAYGTPEQQQRLLSGIAGGAERVTVAVAESTGQWTAAAVSMQAEAEPSTEGGFRLSGEKLFVPDALTADRLLVIARSADGLALFQVDPTDPAVTLRGMNTVDRSRNYSVVTFQNCAAARIGQGSLTETELDRVLDIARTALAAELAGLAETALDLSVDYAGVREQFGRAIGSFQSIQHKCADMKVDLENTKSLVYFAAWAIDEGQQEAALAAAAAKAYASDACPRVVAEAVQVHGGIGFTWEHDLHMIFKRAKADEMILGDATENREWIARELLAEGS